MMKKIAWAAGLFALVCGLVLTIGVWMHLQGYTRLPVFEAASKDGGRPAAGTVPVKIMVSCGGQKMVSMKLSIPCSGKTQQKELTRKLPQLKSDLLIRLDPQKIEDHLEGRNFAGLKADLLDVINRHTREPVQDVYLDSLLY